MNIQHSIAILGGMGPEASGSLYKLLMDLAIRKYGAKNNNDFPEIILYSIPVPDFISNNKNRNHALEMLKQKVELINDTNVVCISIACNTAHVLLPELQAVSKAPFVSMIDETAKQVYLDGKKKIGLMGTPSTIRYALFQKELSKVGVFTVLPSGQQIGAIEKIIRNLLQGKTLISDRRKILSITDSLQKKGAQGIILGCTELPLIFPEKYSLPIYDPVKILATALLKKYYSDYSH